MFADCSVPTDGVYMALTFGTLLSSQGADAHLGDFAIAFKATPRIYPCPSSESNPLLGDPAADSEISGLRFWGVSGLQAVRPAAPGDMDDSRPR